VATVAALVLAAAPPAMAYVRAGATERVSVAGGGAQGDDFSSKPAISADARLVAFESLASNLVPGDTNGVRDVFVHDRATGTTDRVSVGTDGTQGDQESRFPSISPDGRFVAFQSEASNLVDGDTDIAEDVFVRDGDTGVITRISVGPAGIEGNDGSSRPAITPDGRFVAFESAASNLVLADLNEVADVFVHDRDSGTTEMASVPSDGTEREEYSHHPAGPFSMDATISADGRFVAFDSQSTRLVPGDANGSFDVFVRDRQARITERVSVASGGAEGDGAGYEPFISADGRYVAFTSTAENQTLENAGPDIMVHDRLTGATEKVVVAGNGAWGNGLAQGAALSADGRLVAFESHSSNLVPGDTNTVQDIFVHDRGAPVGVGAVSAFAADDRINVSGWATFSGQVMASAVDPPTDGAPGAGPAGAELTGASVIWRPENEDILVRLRLASVPGNRQVCVGAAFCIHSGTGVPAVLYGLEFTEGVFRYEARAVRSATELDAAPRYDLYRCFTICEKVGEPVSGGIGTAGDEVWISISVRGIGQPNGGPVSGIRAFTAIGEADSGALVPVDELALPDTAIPRLAVTLGVAPAGTPQSEVAFGPEEAIFGGGDFWGSVEGSSAGQPDVWARACLGQECGASRVPVSAP